MAHHLYQITNPLKQYLSSRFSKQWRLNKSIDLADTENLPAPLFVAQVRGAAILKECFFKELDQKRITDPVSQRYAWHQLLISGNCLQEVMESSGATSFFHLNTKQAYSTQCFNAYCIILWDASTNNSKLRETLTSGLVNHYLPTIYPNKAKEKTPEQFKKDIAKLLASHWQAKPEIKESFIASDEGVSFSIIAKLKGHSVSKLITLEGKRLNITRKKAYEACLKQIEFEAVPFPSALTALKHQPTKSF